MVLLEYIHATVLFGAVCFKVGFSDAVLLKNVTFHTALNMMLLQL